jgi:MFS family permease
MTTASSGSRSGLTAIQWLVCIIAAIGFTFDIYELLMAPLVFPDAIRELEGLQPVGPTRDAFLAWVGWLFFLPAVVGGIFGLLGGYLTDTLGRRRVLTFSILLYAISAFLSGFVTDLRMLLFLRCTTFVGVCVEFVAATAWLAELFDDPKRREQVLGYTQAFSSIGGFLVAFAYGLCGTLGPDLPEIHVPQFLAGVFGQVEEVGRHAAWRYTLMSGLLPALPLIIIRPFLPESPKWQAKKNAGTLQRPSFAAVFAPGLRRTTIVTTLMVACSYGVAFGAIQQMQHILPGLPEVAKAKADKVAEFREQNATLPADKLDAGVKRAARGAEVAIKSNVTETQEVGGLVGRFILAVIVVYFASRRNLLRVFLVPGLIVVPFTFAYALTHNLTLAYIGMFLTGLLTVAQFSFWGNYLPQVYPLHLRGTGESVAANIGGRMIGTSFAAITTFLATQSFMPGSEYEKTAYTAAIVGTGLYLANFILSFFLPEPAANIDEDETIGHSEVAPLFPATVEPKKA